MRLEEAGECTLAWVTVEPQSSRLATRGVRAARPMAWSPAVSPPRPPFSFLCSFLSTHCSAGLGARWRWGHMPPAPGTSSTEGQVAVKQTQCGKGELEACSPGQQRSCVVPGGRSEVAAVS